jgi:hypothetical protein
MFNSSVFACQKQTLIRCTVCRSFLYICINIFCKANFIFYSVTWCFWRFGSAWETFGYYTGWVFPALRGIITAKSPVPDNIPNKILKTFAFELAPVISDLYNSSLRQWVFPALLKRSFVIPIPKMSTLKLMEEDLRPISLTSQGYGRLYSWASHWCPKSLENLIKSNLHYRENQQFRH